jgi:large subunit ribosomal protein L32
MAVPKQRKTKGRRNQRRMHIHLSKPTLTECSQCKEKKVMHTVCDACGYYKGREVIDVFKKDKKKEEKVKQAKEVEKKEKEKEKPLDPKALSKKK